MRKWFVMGLAGIAGVAALGLPLVAQAIATPTNGSPGQGLEISPPVIELTADPGQTITTHIRVRNVTQGILIAKGKADDFGAGSDESGQPKLLLDETGATRYSLKYWVQGVPDMQLAPQELKDATITIAVPRNAEPGGHFGVIRFTAVPPDLQGTGVALSASVGTLVLLRVSGAVTEKLSVEQFATMRGENPTSFFENGPVNFLVRIKNEGTVHDAPKGSVTVYNLFGRKEASVAVNPNGGNVLPDSIRRFEQNLPGTHWFGHYTAKLSLAYAGNQTLTASAGFWVIPWRLVLVVIAALVVLFFAGKWGLRKYNEHIIAIAQGKRK